MSNQYSFSAEFANEFIPVCLPAKITNDQISLETSDLVYDLSISDVHTFAQNKKQI